MIASSHNNDNKNSNNDNNDDDDSKIDNDDDNNNINNDNTNYENYDNIDNNNNNDKNKYFWNICVILIILWYCHTDLKLGCQGIILPLKHIYIFMDLKIYFSLIKVENHAYYAWLVWAKYLNIFFEIYIYTSLNLYLHFSSRESEPSKMNNSGQGMLR